MFISYINHYYIIVDNLVYLEKFQNKRSLYIYIQLTNLYQIEVLHPFVNKLNLISSLCLIPKAIYKLHTCIRSKRILSLNLKDPYNSIISYSFTSYTKLYKQHSYSITNSFKLSLLWMWVYIDLIDINDKLWIQKSNF